MDDVVLGTDIAYEPTEGRAEMLYLNGIALRPIALEIGRYLARFQGIAA